MHRITADEILELHDAIVSTSGGAHGVLNWAGLEAAVEQPFLTFGGEDLYPTLVDKAATLGFLIIRNHVFVDGTSAPGTPPCVFYCSWTAML